MKLGTLVRLGAVLGVVACGGKETGNAPDAKAADAAIGDHDGAMVDAPTGPGTPDAGVDAAVGGCNKTITTAVSIDDTDTAGDIAALAGVKSVKQLTITSKNLQSLAGLECLTTVTDYMSINGTQQLANLDGLSGLRDIPGFFLENNAGLKNMAGLEGITQMNGAQITNNQMLCGVPHFVAAMKAKLPNVQIMAMGNANCP